MNIFKAMAGIYAFFIIGWVINIITFVQSFTSFTTMTGFQIIQIIGVFTGPIGSIIGYISLL